MDHPAADDALPDTTARARELFLQQQQATFRFADRLFGWLLLAQWVAGIAVAFCVSPYTWSGLNRQTHPHVWAAILLGGSIACLPAVLAFTRPGHTSTRHLIALGQMLLGALLIHLGAGRIEMHFHVFGSLAFLAIYRDWRVLITASLVVSADHYLRGVWWPQSIYGESAPDAWRWLEHAFWVVFEVTFLTLACVQGNRQARAIARQQADHERDMIERARLERDLLERRCAERELHADKEAAEAASRTKSLFLANMSHELRTPMNSIMGFTQRLLRRLKGNVSERDLDALETVDRNARHLLGLINDILDVSKIEAGKMDLQKSPSDLCALVRDVVTRTAPLAETKQLPLRTVLPDGPVTLDVDPVKFQQVITNLVSNAIKFTDAGGVTVSVEETDDIRLGRAVRVRVRDSGVGVKPEDLPRLFQQFQQLDSSTTKRVGGTGLGLYITARFVEMHGGRIDVESEFGVGSTFTALFPRPASYEAPPVTPSEMLAAGTGVTILCVDDNPDVLKFLKFTFEDVGYRVALAPDYDAAIRLARTREPSLICLDLCMPGKDGFAVMDALRADPDLSNIPVVVVSVTPDEVRVMKAGARCCLTKPVAAEALLTAVRGLLLGHVSHALVVEDDPDASRLVVETLNHAGIATRTAANGLEGLESIAVERPSVVLLDLMMPVMDGFEFLRRLRANPEWANIPVITLSARTLEPAERQRLNAVCSGILTKGRDQTVQVIDSVLKAVARRPAVKELVS
jgi:two-component system sensor histidine kinase/response regulator